MFGGRKRRRAVWSQVATDLGGTHQTPTKWWRGDEAITAAVHGVQVKLDCYVVSTGKTTHVYTRVAADYAHGPGPKLKVYKKGFWQALGQALGLQDIAIGHAQFDDTFIVKSNSVAVARRLWSPPAIARMLELADAWLVSKPERLELIGGGRWEDPVRMRAAVELIGELAARDLYGSAALRATGATYAQPEGERPRIELDTGTRVVVMAEDRDDQLVMVARGEAVDHEPLEVAIVEGRAELASKLPQAAQVHLQRVGTGTLTTAPLAFAWSSLELDPDRLRAGAELLGAISVRGGVYR